MTERNVGGSMYFWVQNFARKGIGETRRGDLHLGKLEARGSMTARRRHRVLGPGSLEDGQGWRFWASPAPASWEGGLAASMAWNSASLVRDIPVEIVGVTAGFMGGAATGATAGRHMEVWRRRLTEEIVVPIDLKSRTCAGQTWVAEH